MVGAAAIPTVSDTKLSPVLEVRRLSKTFGRTRVLTNVDFDVRPGEVHCLLGHNGSGKSTLIKVLGGIHDPDEGCEILMGGATCPTPLTAQDIRDRGARFVHQSLGLIPSLTVAEHFAQDRLEGRAGWFLSPSAAHKVARSALGSFDVSISPDKKIEDLSAVDRALVAIVRAVTSLDRRPEGIRGALLILDEPTSFLPREEVERLFETTRRVAEQGAGIILVTHDTDEVLAIADRVTVLRDGHVAGEVDRKELTREGLVKLIIGRELKAVESRKAAKVFEVGAEVKVTRLGAARELEFTIGRGEIVGVTGLIGSGYDDLVHGIFGSTKGQGSIRIGGDITSLAEMTPARAIKAGLAFIPSDRAGAAASLQMSVAENAGILSLPEFVNPLGFTASKLERAVLPWLRETDVRPLEPSLEMARLSGGNQQKVVLAKWLASKPELLLLDEPTQGIDVGAREQIFDQLRSLVSTGASILCASTDNDQLAQICDRVLIMNNGRLVAELTGAQITSHAISEAVLSAPEQETTGI